MRVAAVAIVAALFVMSSMLIVGVSAQESVELATADPFAILAGSTVTNSGSSVITGDIGLHPGTSVTGFGDATVNGQFHIANDVAQIAKADLLTAYNDAAARPVNETIETELGTKELLPGVYNSDSGTFGITGQLTLNAENDTDAVWIFKMASTLTTAVDSSVVLTNGAQACNVFWQVGSSATINAGTDLKGNILAQTSISMGEGANLDGRALALDGAVTLINNVITIAECDEPPVEPPGDEPPGEEPPGEDPPGEEPPGEEPPGEEPPGEEPPGEEPPGEEPPGEEPPGEEPPGEEPPGEESPGEEPPGAEPPLACSTGLMATASADTSITLTWTDVQGAEAYRIHRAVSGGDFNLHDEVDGNTTTFTDADTEVDVAFGYEVRPVVGGVELQDCDRVEVTAIPFFPGLLTGALAFLGAVAAYPLSRRHS